MSFSLGELLAQPGFVCDVLVVGEPAREVRWVHASETTDPTPYLRGGEVVLTDGLWLSDAAAADPYVERMRRAGVAALGFGLMPANPEVPPPLIEACARHGLCLFAIPEPVPYIDLTEVFFDRLAADRESSLALSVERHARFLDVARTGADPEALLRQLELEVAAPAWISTGRGQVVCRAGHVPAPADRCAVAATLAAAGGDGSAPSADAGGWRLEPVVCDGAPPWFVAVASRPALEPAQLVAVEQAIPFLEIARAQAWSRTRDARRLASELVELIDAGEDEAVHVAARLATAGIDSRQSLAVVACAGEDLEAVLEDAELALDAAGLTALATAEGHRVVAVVAWDGGADGLGRLAALVRERVDTATAVGVGSLARDSRALRTSLIEARQQCRAASARGAGAGHADAAGAGSHRLLLDLHETEVLRAFSSALLDPVVEHDRRHNGQLLLSLTRFLELDCHWQATADALFVHVNTLRHRLARIEQLTGRQLGSTAARVDFFLAIRCADRV